MDDEPLFIIAPTKSAPVRSGRASLAWAVATAAASLAAGLAIGIGIGTVVNDRHDERTRTVTVTSPK